MIMMVGGVELRVLLQTEMWEEECSEHGLAGMRIYVRTTRAGRKG